MVNLWYAEAGANDGFPLDDRSPLEILGRRPAPARLHRAAGHATSGNHAEVPEAQAVVVRGRSFVIGAVVDIPAPGAQGGCSRRARGSGGHALYVKDNRLHYV